MKNKIKVLIVDDSPIVRQALKEIISEDENIEIMGEASNPYNAVEIIKENIPDVMVLDIEMPKMDGLTFLQKIMNQHPLPIIIFSSVAETGSVNALKALEYGAVDVVYKPRLGTRELYNEAKITIVDSIKAASIAKLGLLAKNKNLQKALSPDTIINRVEKIPDIKTDKIVAIGASTGGTQAIEKILLQMPSNTPGIVIVQHMPKHFTNTFAKRLNTICQMEVREAKNGDEISQGVVLVAPGGEAHTLLKRRVNRYFIEIKKGPLISRHRPSVDVLFRSFANNAGRNSIGVIMTGMGSDGAMGMLEMKNNGAYNIAQNEESCVVFGMPKKAIENGAVNKIVPLQNIAREVLLYCQRKK